jgi:hypothetical protein
MEWAKNLKQIQENKEERKWIERERKREISGGHDR